MSKNPGTISIRKNGKVTGRFCIALILLLAGGLIARLPFTDNVVRAAASFLTSVTHNATLAGEGTAAVPLAIANDGVGTSQIANEAVTAPKIAAGQVVKSVNGLRDDITLAAGSNVSLQLTGQTLTIASTLGLTSVAHDGTLAGNGTSLSPLTIPDGAITTEHIFSGQVVKAINNLRDGVTLVGGSNVTITPTGNNTLTVAANVPPQPPYINPKRVALLQWYEANQTNTNFSLPTTPEATFSMCFDGTHLWITDSHTSSVSKIRASDGVTVGNFPTGGLGAYGVAFDGSSIWVGNQERITRLRASDGVLLGTIDFPSGGVGMSIAFDGLHIWVVGATTGHIYKIRATDGTLSGDFNYTSLGVFLIHGLAFDGTNIWATVSNPNKVIKIRPSDGVVVGNFSVGTIPIGIAFDGSNIWIANSGSNSVTKLRANDGAVVGTFNVGNTPAAITFDGRSMWVANFVSNNVTKLLASDGTNLGTFNVGTAPRAISFDGANVYILNHTDNTITRL